MGCDVLTVVVGDECREQEMALMLLSSSFFLKRNYDDEFTSSVLTGKQLERCSRSILSTNSAYILKNT